MRKTRGTASTKFLATLRDFRKTAYHHYGDSPSSILKFLYYGGMRINTFIIYRADLTGELPELPLDPGYRVIKPSLEELARYRNGRDLPREFFYDQLAGVRNCYLALKGDEPAHVNWVFLKGDPNRFLKLDDGAAELNYNATLPGFRGNRLQAKVLSHICRDLRELGYTRAYGVIHELNPPSRKSAELAGFREIGKIRALGPFHRKVAF